MLIQIENMRIDCKQLKAFKKSEKVARYQHDHIKVSSAMKFF